MKTWFDRLANDPRVRKSLPYLFLGIILVAGYVLLGDSRAEMATGELDGSASLTLMSIGVFLRLAVIIAMIYAIFYFLRWWQNKKTDGKERRLAVVETVRLTQKQALHIVRLDRREYLVGATDQSMRLIAEVGEPPEGLTFSATLDRQLEDQQGDSGGVQSW